VFAASTHRTALSPATCHQRGPDPIFQSQKSKKKRALRAQQKATTPDFNDELASLGPAPVHHTHTP